VESIQVPALAPLCILIPRDEEEASQRRPWGDRDSSGHLQGRTSTLPARDDEEPSQNHEAGVGKPMSYQKLDASSSSVRLPLQTTIDQPGAIGVPTTSMAAL
jgi:hypothetical protein